MALNTGLTSLGLIHSLDPSVVIYHYFINSLILLSRFKEIFLVNFLVVFKEISSNC